MDERRRNINLFIILLLFACLALNGCTGGGTVVGNPSLDFEIEGAAQKGPFVINSKVEIQPLSETGETAGKLISTETINSIGDFKFQTNQKDAMQLTAQGYHMNELTGKLSGGMLTLKAIYFNNGEANQYVFINALTHLIHKRVLYLMQEGVGVEASIAQAQDEFLLEFKAVIDKAVQIDQFTHLSIYNVDGTEQEGNAYLLLTSAALYQYATTQSALNQSSVDAELTAVLNTLCSDLQPDGILDQTELLNAIKLSLAELDKNAIEENLKNQSANVFGSPLSIPNIERYMNQILIVYPAEGAEVSDPTNILLALPSGLTEVSYTLLIDGQEVDTVSEEPFAFSWNPYYWSGSAKHTLLVQAEDAFGSRINSNLINVDIPVNANSALSLLAPPDNQIFKDANQVELGWEALEDAATYDVQVANGPEFTLEQLVHVETVSVASLTSPALPVGEYCWRLRATNALGQTGAWSEHNVFSISGPDAPLPASPSDGTVFKDVDQVTLGWQPAEYAQTYEIQISAGVNFAAAEIIYDGIVSAKSLTTPTIDIGSYYWRVCSINDVGYAGAWSAATSFEIAPPDLPILQQPIVTKTGDTYDVTFSWDAQPGESSYTIFLKNMDKPDAAELIESTNSNSLTFVNIALGNYECKIQRTNALGQMYETILPQQLEVGVFIKRFGGSSKGDKAHKIIASKFGGYIILGETMSDDWIFKVSDEGEVLWQYISTWPGEPRYKDLIELTDGSVVAVGNDLFANQAAALKLNEQGTKDWEFTYRPENIYERYDFTQAVEFNNLVYVSAAEWGPCSLSGMNCFGTTIINNYLHTISITDGTVSPPMTVPEMPDLVIDSISVLKTTSAGNLLLAGTAYSVSTGYYDGIGPYLLELDAGLTPLMTWSDVDNYSYNYVGDAIELPNGNFAIVGTNSGIDFGVPVVLSIVDTAAVGFKSYRAAGPDEECYQGGGIVAGENGEVYGLFQDLGKSGYAYPYPATFMAFNSDLAIIKQIYLSELKPYGSPPVGLIKNNDGTFTLLLNEDQDGKRNFDIALVKKVIE